MLHKASKGLARWRTPFFEQAAAELLREGYFEPKVRHRGEAAAKVIPDWVAPQPEPEQVSVAEAVKRNRTVISAEEAAELRNLPDEELRARARQGMRAYNPTKEK